MIVLDEKTLHGMWNYFLMLESDLDNTSRYIEPQGQENVYSFEFAKLLVLACTEIESVLKVMCKEIDPTVKADKMSDYQPIITHRFPKITEAHVEINRLGRSVQPFLNWDAQPLTWWRAYNGVKHNRESNFKDATYMNAVMALSGLYILIFYLSALTGLKFRDHASNYIKSDYEHTTLFWAVTSRLPDFEESK